MLSTAKGFLTRPATTSYYVSPTGSDGADGLTTVTPFATPTAALAVAPAGSAILLERGGVWTSEVIVATNGITLGAYGSGALPVIDRGTGPTGGIFDDGFESETSAFTTNWGGKTEAGSSTVTLDTTTPIAGSQSLKYTHATGGTAYVTKTFTAASEVYVQFKVKINKLAAAAADYQEMRILQLLGGWGLLYLAQDTTSNAKRGVQVRVQGGDAMNIYTPTYYQEGQTLRIEFHYRKNGGANATQCWVNGNLVAATDSSDAGNATGFRLGVMASDNGGLGATSELLFDDVKVSATALGVGTRGDNGITVDTANDCTIQDIEVRNAAQYLIKLRDSTTTTVRRAKLHDSTLVGLIASIGGGSHTIDACEVWFTGGDVAAYGEGNAIQFLDTTTGVNTVSNNYIHHIGDQAGDHGIYSEGGANVFTNNRFYGVAGYGVKCLGGSAGSTVARNRMEFCRTGVVLVDSAATMSSPVLIYHNSAYMCGVYPDGLSPYVDFWITGYGSAELVNNISSGGAIGIEVDANATLSVSNTNDIMYDIRWGYWKAAGDQAALSNWRSASSLDAASIESDPLFTDPDAGDLTLQGGSPCIDTGTVLAGINDGYTGTAPDMGYVS